ncbi:MAG: zinc ABC transporter substrate-binding protein [Dehalococcoidia bacterium]|nr:zinc ABC transporter substrate-binding protein [Dehalococcoidia bacterium]
MDIDLTIEAVEAIRDELSRLDPDGADYYRERADAYIGELRELDAEIREQLAGLPQERRYLVTFHDAYGYFAERYGLTILGFVVEGPEEEPSASAISELVESIEELGIPYIFSEPQFSARVIEQIAADTGTTVRTIPSGALAEEYPTYVEFLRAIANGIAE